MKRIVIAAALAVLTAATTTPAHADHSWGGYHWSRPSLSAPVTLTVVDSVTTSSTTNWDAYLPTVLAEWDAAPEISFAPVQAGSISNKDRKQCRPVSGKIRACNATYGFNGWLGLAQIWLSGGHIVQGVVKLNDSYFNTSSYNNTHAKKHVFCQEIGHDFGLDHQYTEASCMDDRGGLFDPAYTSPASHDFAQLSTIYAHEHATTASAQKKAGSGAKADGHRHVRRDGAYTLVTYVVHAHPHR